jgi:hypothetical protein
VGEERSGGAEEARRRRRRARGEGMGTGRGRGQVEGLSNPSRPRMPAG